MPPFPEPPDGPDREERRAALDHVVEAFAEGCLDGIDARCLVEAALTTAFRELVATRGEEEAARYAADLPDQIRAGRFSAASRH